MENLAVDLQAYAGRRVLVTGHTGFKGGWLALWLEHLGAQVYGLALPPDTTPALFDEADLSSSMESHIADLRDANAVAEVLAQTRPEIIFHLAAQPLVRRGLAAPLETFATNVMGTAHLLNAVRACTSVRAIVVVTTDKCYDNHGWPWSYREADRLGGHDPYSASKACAELAVAAWRASYWQSEDAPLVATARAGNVIGGGDWAEDRLIPDLVRAARAGRPALIRNPTAVRPWQHVLEPLAGYLILGARLLSGESRFADAWNFGPTLEDMKPVSALCDAFCPATGGGWLADCGEHPSEAAILRLDSSRAHLELGWRPRWDLARALHTTGQWHARHDAGDNARELILEQIGAYEAGAGDSK